MKICHSVDKYAFPDIADTKRMSFSDKMGAEKGSEHGF